MRPADAVGVVAGEPRRLAPRDARPAPESRPSPPRWRADAAPIAPRSHLAPRHGTSHPAPRPFCLGPRAGAAAPVPSPTCAIMRPSRAPRRARSRTARPAVDEHFDVDVETAAAAQAGTTRPRLTPPPTLQPPSRARQLARTRTAACERGEGRTKCAAPAAAHPSCRRPARRPALAAAGASTTRRHGPETASAVRAPPVPSQC